MAPPTTSSINGSFRLGPRLLFYGWAGLVAACFLGMPVADEALGKFGDGQILVRPWMWLTNRIFAAWHLVCLAALLAGTALSPAPSRPSRWARLGAAICWTAALVLAAVTLLFPSLFLPGPWMPDAPEVRLLRVLVFAPSVLRAAGLALAVWWLGARSDRPRDRRLSPILALTVLDLALVVWRWAVTPKAVIVLIHPLGDRPAMLAPFVLAGALFLWMLRRAPEEKGGQAKADRP